MKITFFLITITIISCSHIFDIDIDSARHKIGYVICLIPLVLKIPVIRSILISKDTQSINVFVIFGQMILNMSMIGFNLHKGNHQKLQRFGEHLLLAIFNLCILGLCLIYRNRQGLIKLTFCITLIMSFAVSYHMDLIPKNIKQYFPHLGIAFVTLSRLIQINKLSSTGKAGSLKMYVILSACILNSARSLHLYHDGVVDYRPHMVNLGQLLLNSVLAYKCWRCIQKQQSQSKQKKKN